MKIIPFYAKKVLQNTIVLLSCVCHPQPTNLMKNKVTLADLKNEITATSGKSIPQLAKLAKQNKDCDGDHDQIKIKSGISIVWIANKNYGQGVKNGFGAGLYAKLQMCGTATQSVKLA